MQKRWGWFTAGALVLGLGGCSEEAQRLEQVRTLIECSQTSDHACANKMICQSSTEPVTYQQILDVGVSLDGLKARNLQFVGKDERGGWTQYNYQLGDKKIYVTFCEDDMSGPIAAISVD